MLQFLGLLSGLLSAICYLPYGRDILRGKTKPERASWFIWSALGLIALFSQLAKGASDSLWLTAVQTLGVSIIFLLSLKYGVGGLVKKDIIALVVAAAGVLLWYFTQEAAFALFIVIGVDTVGTALTVHKTYHDPESETFITWLLASISGLFAALAVGELNWILLSYPFYIMFINFSVMTAIVLGSRKK
jgi:hypothetical protein